MNPIKIASATFLAAALPALSVSLFAAGNDVRQVQVIVNIDMTAEGKKVPRPTPEKPAYYVPVTLGYHTAGEIIAGEKPPARAEMIRQLGQALAKEGYVLQALRPDANKTTPSLILTFEWGYLNPQKTDFGEDPAVVPVDSSQEIPRVIGDFNHREMLTLVAGDSIYRSTLFSESEWERLRDAVDEGRYYVIVSAFDFAASLKGERVLLWRARMSTERQGIWMDDVLAALVTSGAPIFGRTVDRPQFMSRPLREGRVDIGTPTVVEPPESSRPRPAPKP